MRDPPPVPRLAEPTTGTATLCTALRDALAGGDGVALRSPDPADPAAMSYAELDRAAPTLKVKRPIVTEHFADLVDELYER